MKVKTVLIAINRHAAIYVCLALFFALCWLIHHLALLRMEMCNRQFLLMNDRTVRAMAVIDLIAANSWWAIAYIVLVVAAVAFLQIRGYQPWTYWAIAMFFCLPCIVYWWPCIYIGGKCLPFE